MALQIWWGHGIVVNGKALEASGLSDKDKDPVGGWYIRAAGTNKITALQENAEAPVWFASSHSEPENLIKGMRSFAREQLKGGITTVQFMGTGFKSSGGNSNSAEDGTFTTPSHDCVATFYIKRP